MKWDTTDLLPLFIKVGVDKSECQKLPNDIKTKKRDKVSKRDGYHCRYCGGCYNKYLHLVSIDDKSTMVNDMVFMCRMCYMITHSSYGFTREMNMYYSLIPQDEIVRRTMDMYILNGSIPSPVEVDPDVKRLSVSLIEFIVLLNEVDYNHLPSSMKKYKIFFTHLLDTTFLNGERRFMFLEDIEAEYDSSDDDEYDWDIIPKYEFTSSEIKLLDKCFTPNLIKITNKVLDRSP